MHCTETVVYNQEWYQSMLRSSAYPLTHCYVDNYFYVIVQSVAKVSTQRKYYCNLGENPNICAVKSSCLGDS